MFASGIFDSPLVIIVIIAVSAVANWLSKRRQEEQADHLPERETPAEPERRKRDFNMEEAVRRILNNEGPARQPAPPPVIRRPDAPRQSPRQIWQTEPLRKTESEWEGEGAEAEGDGYKTIVLQTPQPSSDEETRASSDPRFAQLSAPANNPAPVVHGGWRQGRNSYIATLRNRQTARHAFAASLVFGPPKGLEQ